MDLTHFWKIPKIDFSLGKPFVFGEGASGMAGGKTGADGLPDSHSRFGDGSIVVADKPGANKIRIPSQKKVIKMSGAIVVDEK